MHRYLYALALLGCGGGSKSPDAAVALEAGPCGSETFFTGDFVDWDSSDATFCGIFQATWTVRGDPAHTDSTNPNGRFELCVPPGVVTLVDITPPTVASECVAPQGQMYTARGIAVADPTSIARGAVFSARAFTTTRRDMFFAAAGLPYDALNAQIVVHLATPAAVSCTAPHDAAQAWNGTAWSASSTGVDVLFPNVMIPGSGTTSITVAGGRTVSVPVVADTITYVTP